MKSRQGKYIPGNAYNQTKEIFIKNQKDKSLLGLYSSEDIPNLTNNEISDSNIKCETFIRQPWNDISTKLQLLKERHIPLKFLKKIDNKPGDLYLEFATNLQAI